MDKQQATDALKAVVDPELGIDIVTLGFIRQLVVEPATDKVRITMTLTTPLCPLKDDIVGQTKAALKRAGASKVELHLEFNPPWQPSPEIKAMLGK